MRHFNPTTWHVATWAVFAVWIVIGLWTNIPRKIDAPSEYARFSEIYTSGTGKPVDPRFTDFYRAVGFPVGYQRHQIMPNLTARLDYNSSVWFLADVFLCLIASASIIYVSQSVQRFSVREMMLGTACIAIAIVFFQRLLPILVHVIVSIGPKFHFFAYAGRWAYVFLYLIPVPFALYLAYRTTKRRITHYGDAEARECDGGGKWIAASFLSFISDLSNLASS